MNSSQTESIINIANNTTHSIKEIIAACSEITNHDITISINPDFIRKNDLEYQRGCNKIISNLGYRQEFSFKDTLAWMLKNMGKP